MKWRKLQQLTLLCLILAVGLAEGSAQEQMTRTGMDHALIFAVSDYHEFDTLENTLNEATRLATVLQTNYGFTVEVVPNPTKDQIDSKLKEYRHFYKFGESNNYTAEGQLLIYFSGHGSELTEGGYFFPVDVEKEKMAKTALSYQSLRKQVNEINCRHILVGIDAYQGASFDPDWTASMAGCEAELQTDTLAVTTADSLLVLKQEINSRRLLSWAGKQNVTPGNSGLTAAIYQSLEERKTDDSPFTAQHLMTQLSTIDSSFYCSRFDKENTVGDFIFYPLATYAYLQQEMPAQLDTPATVFEITWPIKDEIDSQMIHVVGSIFRKGDEFKVGEEDESPSHMVEVSSFLMSSFEVTQGEYQAYCMARGIERKFDPLKTDYPIDSVSWYAAIEYCNWLSLQHGFSPVYSIDKRRKDIRNSSLQDKLKWKIAIYPKGTGYRLPTESEWEFAARSRGKHYIWTGTRKAKEVAQFANYRDTSLLTTDSLLNVSPVGSLASNEIGLFDMSGNVAEWCWDWYNEKHYANGKKTNDVPSMDKGPRRGKFRVAKGGAWNDPLENIRVSNRIPLTADHRFNTIGFRLVRSVEE